MIVFVCLVAFPSIYFLNIDPIVARLVRGIGFFITIMGVLGSLFGTKTYRIYKGRVKLEGQVSGESRNGNSGNESQQPSASPSGKGRGYNRSRPARVKGSEFSAGGVSLFGRGVRSSQVPSSMGERAGGEASKVSESAGVADGAVVDEPLISARRDAVSHSHTHSHSHGSTHSKHAPIQRYASVGKILDHSDSMSGTVLVSKHGHSSRHVGSVHLGIGHGAGGTTLYEAGIEEVEESGR